MINKTIDLVASIMMWISVAALAIVIAVNAYEIFARFAFGKSLYWIQDVTLLCMMWFIFPGMVTVSYKGADVFVDYFIGKFRPKVRVVVEAINDLLVFVICVILAYYSVNLSILRAGKAMSTSEIPVIWYTLAMIVSFALMAVVYFERFIKKLLVRGGNVE